MHFSQRTSSTALLRSVLGSTIKFASESARQVHPTDIKNKSVGVVVAEFRPKAGVSQEQLGSDCGFDRTYISRLERGILNPTVSRLWKIADSLQAPFHLMVKGMEDWALLNERARR